MKATFAILIACLLFFAFYLNKELAEMEAKLKEQQEYIEALDHVVHAQEYKRSAQLYLLCSNPSPETLQLLADSCKAECVRYKQSK